MLKARSLFWLPFILIVTQNLGLSRGTLVEKWIEQYQDHFDLFNDKTWSMRYYENNEFYKKSGPIFIHIGGQSELTLEEVEGPSLVNEMAEAFGAMIYHTEHRYYGKSHPVPDTSLENLRYLSVSQALADIELFIETKKKELNNTNAFTMVTGCSYSGNLAAWMRVTYPHLVQGALANSAPVYVKADFYEYYEYLENAIRKYDKRCAMNIKEAFSAVNKLLDGQIFTQAVRGNQIEENGKTSIENVCRSMAENGNLSPYFRLVELHKKRSAPTFRIDYGILMIILRATTWETQHGARFRPWFHQTCTELGYFMTLSSPTSIFGSSAPLQYYIDQCRDIFGAGFNQNHLEHNIREIDRLYNSKLPKTTNIIFTNGDLDPWRSLSVLSDLNEDSPAILIDGASHCEFPQWPPEIDSVTAATCEVCAKVYEWIHKFSVN